MTDYAVLTPATQVRQLLPRYRRVLTFGDVLDESIQLYRQHWIQYVLVSAISLVPPGLIAILFAASGLTARSVSIADFQPGRSAPLASTQPPAAVWLELVIVLLFSLVWWSAIVATTNSYLRGTQPTVRDVYGIALKRFLKMLGAMLLLWLALICLFIASLVLMVVTLAVVGIIVAVIGLLVWWLRPGARKGWLKWLVILTTWLGLFTYYGVYWSMAACTVVLEGPGPISALQRSSQLVHRYWFRVFGILAISGVIVFILQAAPALIIEIPLTISAAARGQIGLGPTESVIVNAVTFVLEILFSSIAAIVYTLTFIDLRNRREGTDIVERLSQLEAAAVTANG